MSSETPANWIRRPLGDMANCFAGGTPSRSNPANFGPGIPWLKSGEVRAGRIVEIEESITPLGLKDSSARVAKAGTPVVAMYGATAGVAGILGVDAALNQAVLAVDPDLDQLEPEFCYRVLESQTRQLLTLTQGSGQPNLSKGLIEQLYVSLPPRDEQRRIAGVLQSLDQAALAADRVTTQIRRVIEQEIDAVIGTLLNDARVPRVKLVEIASVKGGKRLPKGSEYEEVPTKNRYVRVTDWEDYRVSPANVRWISDDVAAAIRRYTISSNDIFISIAGSIGFVGEVPPELDGAFLTENAAKIVLRDQRAVDAGYLLVALRSEYLAEQIRQQKGVGGGVPKLALFRIEDLDLPLPPIDVQREIAASYLSLMSARGLSAEGTLAARRLKASLSDDLLSGRVRVPA